MNEHAAWMRPVENNNKFILRQVGPRAYKRQSAFTLLEIVVVLAVTAVVFGLLLRPILSSLSLTQEAQSLAAAQDSGSKALEILSRELSHADYVFSGMSHPFTVPPTTTIGSSTDTYTDFLDIEVPSEKSLIPNGYTIAHVYGAKLDFALAQGNQVGSYYDPTSHRYFSVQSSSSGAVSEQPVPAILPLAADTTLVRYFVGLQTPIVNQGVTTGPGHYSNENIGLSITGQGNNTYVLYRAQVNLYMPNPANPNGPEIPNSNYFAVSSSNTPEIDDPDFFRYVSSTDINWLDPAHATYGTEATVHNSRVENWMLIAKQVVSAPQIDLLDIPRNSSGGIAYDNNGIPSNGANNSPAGSYAIDPVSGATGDPDISGNPTKWPIANVTVSFSPTVYQTDSPTPTASDNSANGATSLNGTLTTGIPYIPTAYSGSHESWSPNYSIRLYPQGYSTSAVNTQQRSYFYTAQTFAVQSNGAGYSDAPGDMIEFRVDGTNGLPGTAVYNITQGFVEPGAETGKGELYNYYVPFTVDADRGYLNFSIHATPPLLQNQNDPTAGVGWPETTGEYADSNPNNPFYVFPYNYIANQVPTPVVQTLDLSSAEAKSGAYETLLAPWNTISVVAAPPNPATYNPIPTLTAPDPRIQNAMMVPGTVRLWGPDGQTGPNCGSTVQYKELPGAGGASPSLGIDQFVANYNFNTISLPTLPTAKTSTVDANTEPDPIAISFNYQANLNIITNPAYPPIPMVVYQNVAPTLPTVIAGNFAAPMTVSASYESGDAISASIGIRVYRPNSALSDLATYPATIAVGNANH